MVIFPNSCIQDVLDTPYSLQGTILFRYFFPNLRANQTNSAGTVDGSNKCTLGIDITGNGNYCSFVSGTKPTLTSPSGGIGNKRGLSFDGILDKLIISNLALTKNIGAFTMFAVCKATGVAGSNVTNEIVYFGTEDGDKGRCSLIVIYGTNAWEMRARRLNSDSPSPLIGSTSITDPTVLCGIVDYTNAKGKLYENSNLVNLASDYVSSGNTSNVNSADSSVGNLTDSGISYPFQGVICEVYAIQGAITPAIAIANQDASRSYYGISQPIITYDTIVTTWLARLVTQGYTVPSTAFIQGLDWLIKGARVDGDLDYLSSLYIFLNQQNAGKVDIIRPTKEIIEVGSPSWSSTTGYTMNGSSYIRSNFIPSSDGGSIFLQDAATIGLNKTTIAQNNGVDFGVTDTIRAIKHYALYTDNKAYSRLNTLAQTSATNSVGAKGLASLARSVSTAQIIYQNATVVLNATSISTGLPTKEVYLGGFNNNGILSEASDNALGFNAFYAGNINIPRFYARLKAFLEYASEL